jgi:hypothetical protein
MSMNYYSYSQNNYDNFFSSYSKILRFFTRNFNKADLHNEKDYFKLYTIATNHPFLKDFSSCINLFRISPTAREVLWSYDLPETSIESDLSEEQIQQIKNIAAICFFSDLIKYIKNNK